MSLDARKTGGLALSFQEVLTAAARLRSKRQDPRDVSVFRQHCRDALLSGAEDARHAGWPSDDVRSASYAVAAYLDEAVMHAADVRFAGWLQKPLELELFHTRDAEENFYYKMRDAIARTDLAASADLVEVYSICLHLGFIGMHGPASGERRAWLESCTEKLRAARGPLRDFSPAWRIPSPWKAPPRTDGTRPAPPREPLSIDELVRQAEIKLSLAGAAGGLPGSAAILVIGEPGSTKTSSLLHCGVEKQELAGDVFRDGNVAPTTLANFWFARPAVLVEAGGALLADRLRWLRLLEHLRPANRSARSAVVCLDVERLSRPNSGDVAAHAAQYLGEHLREFAHAAAGPVPVYVLFTRMDRVTGFPEFVRKLSHEEAARAIGATLPQHQGVDTAAAHATRLKTAWDGIYRSLASARTELLGRESDWARAGVLYEFPREFQKLKAAAVRFLSELCPPGSPGGPFLRGFYCSGARPIVVEDNSPPPPAAASTLAVPVATAMFGGPAPARPQPAAAPRAPSSSRKKIPQWLFLPHLFHEVLLRDTPES